MRFVERLLAERDFMVLPGGRLWLWFNPVNLHTREEHIRCLADLLDGAVRGPTPG